MKRRSKIDYELLILLLIFILLLIIFIILMLLLLFLFGPPKQPAETAGRELD
jgi:hypothetical protein